MNRVLNSNIFTSLFYRFSEKDYHTPDYGCSLIFNYNYINIRPTYITSVYLRCRLNSHFTLTKESSIHYRIESDHFNEPFQLLELLNWRLMEKVHSIPFHCRMQRIRLVSSCLGEIFLTFRKGIQIWFYRKHFAIEGKSLSWSRKLYW